MFNKVGIDYTIDKKQKSFRNFFNFVEASSTHFTTYHYCMHKGHSSKNCVIRRYGVPNGRYR